jgi:hypothetical protein
MKISDKLKKVNETAYFHRYDNGYMMEVGGRTFEDDYETTKIIVDSIDDVIELLKDYNSLPVDK